MSEPQNRNRNVRNVAGIAGESLLQKEDVGCYATWSPRSLIQACLLPAAGSQLNAFFRRGTRHLERAPSQVLTADLLTMAT